MLMCITIENNCFISVTSLNSTVQIRIWVSAWPLLLFLYLLHCILICFILCHVWTILLWRIFQICPRECKFWVIRTFLFILGTPQNAGFWIFQICSFQPNSKSVFAHSGMVPQVLVLSLSGSSWTVSSSSSYSVLLLKDELTSHVS